MGRLLKFPRHKRLRLQYAIALTIGFGFAAAWFAPSVAPFVASGVRDALAWSIEKTNTPQSAAFAMCGWGARTNCVIDGDTFYFHGTKIRVADIDAPETHPPRCGYEARLGDQATRTLLMLLNAGPFTLADNPDGRDEDRYGRKLRIVLRDGVSIGALLVARGLARTWSGHRLPWCT